jgi:hypothetical protein
MKTSIILLFLLAATLRNYAGDGGVLPPNLGDGEPRLFIAYNLPNEWVVFVDESLKKEWKPKDEWWPLYRDKPIKILAGHNLEYADEYADYLETHDLFPFDEQTVFACDGDPNIGGWPRESRVFSTNGLVSRDVDSLARARYGLGTNQWFVGKIGTNIFYTETGKRNVIYFRTTREKFAVNYFKLPGGGDIIWGVKRAIDANKDVGFCIDRKLGWFECWKYFPVAPEALPSFAEFSLRNARHRKIPKNLQEN